MTFLTEESPLTRLPRYVGALMILDEVFSLVFNQADSQRFLAYLWFGAAIDKNIRPVDKPIFVPLFALARLPRDSAHVTKLSTTSTGLSHIRTRLAVLNELGNSLIWLQPVLSSTKLQHE